MTCCAMGWGGLRWIGAEARALGVGPLFRSSPVVNRLYFYLVTLPLFLPFYIQPNETVVRADKGQQGQECEPSCVFCPL